MSLKDEQEMHTLIDERELPQKTTTSRRYILICIFAVIVVVLYQSITGTEETIHHEPLRTAAVPSRSSRIATSPTSTTSTTSTPSTTTTTQTMTTWGPEEFHNCRKLFEEFVSTHENISYVEGPVRPPRKFLMDMLSEKDIETSYIHNYKREEDYRNNTYKWSNFDELYNMHPFDLMRMYPEDKEKALLAFRQNRRFTTQKDALILGTKEPWPALYALQTGARSVTVIEHNKIEINSKLNARYLHPLELAKNWEQHYQRYNSIFSYDGISHEGLGRYGEPLDPDGDKKALARLRCLMRPTGSALIGLPVGKDALIYNQFRIYSVPRLEALFKGFFIKGYYNDEAANRIFTVPLEIQLGRDIGQYEWMLVDVKFQGMW